MELRHDYCVIGLKPADGEYASADTEAAKVVSVVEPIHTIQESTPC
jgi:hypothetical protein